MSKLWLPAAATSKARFAVYGTSLYPDATGTLRLTYGRVKGWTQQGRAVHAAEAEARGVAGTAARADAQGERLEGPGGAVLAGVLDAVEGHVGVRGEGEDAGVRAAAPPVPTSGGAG